MNADRISVVLINYNCEKWLPESMDSVLRQDWPELELIAVDDCSTDGSWAVMESFARRDSRVRLAKTPENSGISVARNLGMAMATGAYIAFLDSDDVFLPDTLSSSHADFLRLEKVRPDLAMIMTEAALLVGIVQAPAWRVLQAWKHGRTAKSAYINGKYALAVWHGVLAALADLPRFVQRARRYFSEKAEAARDLPSP